MVKKTAVKIAVRSAQQVRPYEPFSTLTPRWTAPDALISAAPTAKPEYPAYAFSAAARLQCIPPSTATDIIGR